LKYQATRCDDTSGQAITRLANYCTPLKERVKRLRLWTKTQWATTEGILMLGAGDFDDK
jgi:hypothetical protein